MLGPKIVSTGAQVRKRSADARAASGSEGFGFDPVFVTDGEARTVAELGDDWKTRNSHRARAAAALARLL